MNTDAYGLAVTTSSAAALDAYVRAVAAALGWKASALGLFREATDHDPGLAVAHAGAAACLFLEERFAEARAASDAARAAATRGLSARERSYVNAVTLWTAGRLPEAETAMREHLREHPRDLAIVQRLYFVFFWQGKFPEMLEATTELVRHHPGSSHMLGMHAFALEEAGRCPEAIRLAEQALALNPDDAWTVHALAHALYEAASFDTGIARVPPATDRCVGLNWFSHHLRWHVALMHFARGEYERASAMSRDVFEAEPSSIAGDLHDSISLLWRLDLAGRSAGDRWKPFAAIARERVSRPGLLFHAAHVAMALTGAGEWAIVEKQHALLRERAANEPSGLLGDVLVPLVEGLHAFAARDYARAVATVDSEVAQVRGEDQIGAELLGEDHEGGVGVVHRQVGVLVEQLAGAAQRGKRRGHQDGAAIEEELDACPPSTSDASQQVRRLCQDRFRACHGSLPGVEEAHTFLMVLLAPVEDRDESASVEEELTGHV